MEELPNETNAVFMDVVRKKMETQDKKISDIQEKMSNPAISPVEIDHIKKSLLEIKAGIQNINFPQKEMQELSASLTTGVRLLKHPVENKMQHHHHVPKIIWITTGLFIGLCFVCTGWYNTNNKLDNYMASDIKYRYLKLKSDEKILRIFYEIDSLYNDGYAMQDSVFLWEHDLQKAVEFNQHLRQKKDEETKLREKLDALDKQNKVRRKG